MYALKKAQVLQTFSWDTFLILDPAVGMKSKRCSFAVYQCNLCYQFQVLNFKTVEGVKRQTPKYAAKIYSFEWITKHFFAKFLNRFNIIFNSNSTDICHGWF